ncbi:MAG: hypothetical protein NW223_18550 [Hyphomicrobiaceae bacterium]|nr:hypothetical protein [Hyphomicrobiaceae bacterium]
MMFRVIGLSLSGIAILILSGCASAPVEDTKFTRRSTSPTALQSDSEQCWRLAQKENITSEEATSNVLVGTVLFGLVGATVVAASEKEALKDPKNYHRRRVHDDCMAKRGYKKAE